MWTIFNDCEYELNIYYNGPIYGGSASISPNSTEIIEIQSGVYRVVASHASADKDITPYSGSFDFKKSTSADSRFIIRK